MKSIKTQQEHQPVQRLRLVARGILLLACLTQQINVAAAEPNFIEQSPVPGGISRILLGKMTNNAPPTANWNNRQVAVTEAQGQFVAIVGIPLSTSPGSHTLLVKHADGSTQNVEFTVQPFTYEEQRLVISDKRKVNPAPVDMERINRENKRLKIVKSSRAESLIASSFDWPLPGPISSPFGLKRFFNDQPRRPHGGIDIAAPEGTPIMAPADGVVLETGDYFFNGNCVFIEHGLGLQTFYAHMSRIDVEIGERVTQGQIIGAVGQTGRVTGPHLHWSVGLNGTWVNPLLVLATDTPPPAE